VGLKPTVGVVSRAGVVPISRSQDCVGPIARTVADCALLMNAIAHRERDDESLDLPPAPRDVDYTAFIGRTDLRGVRLGFLHQYAGISEKGDAIVAEALRALKALGAQVIDVDVPAVGQFTADEIEVLFHEFKDGVDRWLARHAGGTRMKSLDDLIAFNREHAANVMPFFGQDAFLRAAAKGPLTSPAYRTALARCRTITRAEGIDAAVRKHRVDALVSMTSQPPWLLDPVNGEPPQGGCTSLAAVSGYPHLTVPAGFAQGLPVGLSFIGPAYSDAKLLGLGAAFERATKHRRAPAFPATVSPAL